MSTYDAVLLLKLPEKTTTLAHVEVIIDDTKVTTPEYRAYVFNEMEKAILERYIEISWERKND